MKPGPVIQLAFEPRLSHAQLGADLLYRQAQCLCRFFGGHAAKETHLDKPCLLWVVPFKRSQSIIDLNQRGRPLRRSLDILIQGKGRVSTASFGSVSRASVIDQDLPHRVCRNTKKVRSILERGLAIAKKPYIGFVYQRRGLKGMPVALLAQIVTRQVPQLPIDERHHPIQRGRIARRKIFKR